jgi:hypothetical protein
MNVLQMSVKYEKGWKKQAAEEELAQLQGDKDNGIEAQMIRQVKEEMEEELKALSRRIEEMQLTYKPEGKLFFSVKNYFNKEHHLVVRRHFVRMGEEFVRSKVEEARAQAEAQVALMQRIMGRMAGNSVGRVFGAWRDWYQSRAGRRTRERMAQTATEDDRVHQASHAEKLVHVEKAKWKRIYDEYTDEPYYINAETGETRWELPTDEQLVMRDRGPPPPVVDEEERVEALEGDQGFLDGVSSGDEEKGDEGGEDGMVSARDTPKALPKVRKSMTTKGVRGIRRRTSKDDMEAVRRKHRGLAVAV